MALVLVLALMVTAWEATRIMIMDTPITTMGMAMDTHMEASATA